jgi:hypothetical protein
MNTIKESLYSTIKTLDDEEARQLLEFTLRLRKRAAAPTTMMRLASDPTFKIPEEGMNALETVLPIKGKGIAASKLLVRDRR